MQALNLLRGALIAALLVAASFVSYATSTLAQTGSTGWTPYTSEELPPVECNAGTTVSGAGCRGQYCDDVRLFCRDASWAAPAGLSYWTEYVSEEDFALSCANNEIMTGIRCSGGYCDNVSMRCTRVGRRVTRDCKWTPARSEEAGNVVWANGYVARGVSCTGSSCDNMSYMICLPGE